MKCPEVEAALVDLAYEQVDAEQRLQLSTHLERCEACREARGRLQMVLAAVDRWTAPPPPRGIAERVLARIADERARAGRQGWPRISPVQILKCVPLGAGAAVVSLLLVVGMVEGHATPLSAGIVGALWTALYGGILLATGHEGLRSVAWSALVGAGIALVLVPPLSIPSFVQACIRWLGAPAESPGVGLPLLALAAAYTAVPLVVGGAVLGRPRRGHRLADGAALSLLYALLIAPAVYLQCLPLPLNLGAIWMAGAVLGAGLGGPISLWIPWWRMEHA